MGRDSKWTKTYALSRSQKEKYPTSMQHDTINLIGSAQEIAKQLKDQKVNGEYLFLAAYVAKDDGKEASDVNGRSSFQSKNEYEPNGISRCDAEELP